jgi:isopentenyl diphosphate isomerase/L-lactate dehydrogenase-like FMN-dependent dehydrogenase
MRTPLFAVIFFCTGTLAAEAEFAFEGFRLGMTVQEASAIRAEIPFQLVMRGSPSEAMRKEFRAAYLGAEALVSVDLDQQHQRVRAIGFTYLVSTDADCIEGAAARLRALEAHYGRADEASSDPPGKRARWNQPREVVRWGEACAVGARLYYVTHARKEG